jgi:hypothetical protein
VPKDAGLTAGRRQVEEGDYETAVTTLEPVVSRLAPSGGPDAARACLYLGIAHLALDQREPARLRFRQALDLGPGLETITFVSSALTIESSPAVPGEVGFSSSAATTVSPASVPRGVTTLRVQTSLTCNNGAGDAPRFNDWPGRGAQGASTTTKPERAAVSPAGSAWLRVIRPPQKNSVWKPSLLRSTCSCHVM